MTSSILESQRSAFEELERIEQAISDRISSNPGLLPDSIPLSTSSSLHGKKKRPFRETVLQQQEISRFVKRYKDQSKFLVSCFDKEAAAREDTENSLHPAVLRKKELALLSGTESDNSFGAVLDQFYTQLGKIKDYHRKYPNETVEDLASLYENGLAKAKHQQKLLEDSLMSGTTTEEEVAEIQATLGNKKGANILLSAAATDLDLDSIFSGEEFYGKYLDLIEFHDKFLNLKFLPPKEQSLSYLKYLDKKFYDFGDEKVYPFATRLRDANYFEYISSLHRYLSQFLIKTHPLEDGELILKRIDNDFNNAWEKKLPFPGWKFDKATTESSNNSSAHGVPDGTETSQGFYCTPCSKYFSKETVYKSHLTGRKHIKNAEVSKTATNDKQGKDDTQIRLVAYHEYCIHSLAVFLEKVVADSKSNVERKRALTDRERQLEQEALDEQDRLLRTGNKKHVGILGLSYSDDEDGANNNNENDDDDDDDEIIYNPLKLPLGWDGKPIPFWLWKLNGLGIEYPCQICGNYVYKGRKEFEKHFMEARHIHGLKCLGIQPNGLFKDITEIKDALKLWEKVKQEPSLGVARLVDSKKDEGIIEMEDDEGNVMSEKVYNDLKKQGLL